jgi:tetratricopeptide (TPR) repeat protein
MSAVSNFNYKSDLGEGLRALASGRLKRAEDCFRRLVKNFPTADGGYRGLARVQVETNDRAGALATLRDGAVVLARAGERTSAIDLLNEAVALDPHDVAVHRRLAAAMALAGDAAGAAREYVRFIRAEIDGDPARARLELSYALETLGDRPELRDLASALQMPERTIRREPDTPRVELTTTTPAEAPVPAAPEEAIPAPEAVSLADRLGWLGTPETAEPAPPTAAASQASALLSAAVELQQNDPQDPVALEERALDLIGKKDRFAGPVAIQAAGALLATGKVHAASDLLLQLVASGIAVHEAQRALVDVARAMGKPDVAAERSRLLGEAERLG